MQVFIYVISIHHWTFISWLASANSSRVFFAVSALRVSVWIDFLALFYFPAFCSQFCCVRVSPIKKYILKYTLMLLMLIMYSCFDWVSLGYINLSNKNQHVLARILSSINNEVKVEERNNLLEGIYLHVNFNGVTLPNIRYCWQV